MKILVYSINFWPEPTSTGKYTGEMTAWLADRGHSVRVITAPPFYPQWKVADGYSAFRYRQESFQGVDVRRCPVWIPAQPNGLKRILCMLIFGMTSAWEGFKALFWHPDVVMVVQPPIASVPSAWLFGRLGGAKLWLHVQDFEVDAALRLGLLRLGALKRLALAIDKFITRLFDRRSTISRRMMDKLADKAGCETGNVLFPNWVDCHQIYPMETSSFRESLELADNQRVALYAGNIGEKQGLDVVVEAARLLEENTDLVFVICGNGAAYDHIRRLGDGLSNILWLPVQPTAKLNDLLAVADVHLLPQKTCAADVVMPSKLTGMLASGRTVLATAHPGTQVYELVQRVGSVVPPEDPQKFADALVKMLASPEQRIEFGRKARRIAEDTLSRDSILELFEKDVVTCLPRPEKSVPREKSIPLPTKTPDPEKSLR